MVVGAIMNRSPDAVSSTGLTLGQATNESPANAAPDAPSAPTARTRRSRRAFGARMLAMFTLVAVVMVGIGVLSDQAMRTFQHDTAQSTSAAMVVAQLDRMLAALKDAESDLRGYVLTERRDQLLGFLAAEPRATAEVAKLIGMVDATSPHSDKVQLLRALVLQRIGQLELTLAAFDKGGIEAARERMRGGLGMADMRQIEALSEDIRTALEASSHARDASTETNAARVRLLDALAIGLCLVTLGLAFWSIRREQMWRALAEIEIKHSHDDLQRSLAKARTLTDRMVQMSKFGELLQGCRSITEAASIARAALPSILDGCGGAIYLLNAQQNTLESVGAWGEHASLIEPIFAPEDCWAIRRNHTFPPLEGAHGVTCAHAHIDGCDCDGCTLCLPMAAQGSVLGVLYLHAPRRFETEQRRVAHSIAEQLALALANLQLQETLRTQSIRDPLTGLFNRRYLDASLLREFTRAERRGLPLAVLMIDVDHFKQFNDTHGHDAGDTVLAQIGQVLTQMSRPEDIACRYGGEELTLVMPEAPPEVAIKRAEEIRLAVARLELSHRNTNLGPVTISIGVAAFPLHGRTLEQVRQASDRALYAAKSAGRDRVMVAPTLASVATVAGGGVVKALVMKS